MLAHGDREQGRGERDADPEAAGHVAEFGIFFLPAVTVRGSSAMPQIGHEPGPGRTICGCMGQVYSVRVAASGTSGSSAMPQEGQAPGFGLAHFGAHGANVGGDRGGFRLSASGFGEAAACT